MKKDRYQLFLEILNEIDAMAQLLEAYDSQLHDYNGVICYQAEMQLIKLIGNHPGISAAECAKYLNKTLSACSQIIKKLKAKNWLIQERNVQNSRIYNLYLTEDGRLIYHNHKEFEERCYQRSFCQLKECSDEEFEIFIRMMKLLNVSFVQDVEEGKYLSIHREEVMQNE